MRSLRTGLFVCVLLSNIPVWGQQTQPGTAPPPAPKDPQAVSVLNQALAVAGGAAAIAAITDFTATGNITYNWNPQEQGSVTVRGLGSDEIRVDASLSGGVRSWAIHDGHTTIRAANGAIVQFPPPYPVPSSDAFPYQTPMFPSSLILPYLQLTYVLNSSSFSIEYKGIVQVDGRSVHDVRIQRIPPGSTEPANMIEYSIKDLFIDTATFQLAMTQDTVPKHTIHQVRYSNYTMVNAMMVPLSISEQLGGQQTWDLALGQVVFNSGLQGSDFALQ